MKCKAKADAPWEATIEVWKGYGSRNWRWSINHTGHPWIDVMSTQPCSTKAGAYEEVRLMLKRFKLVEVTT